MSNKKNRFDIKIYLNGEPIIKAKKQNEDELDCLFNDFRRKYK